MLLVFEGGLCRTLWNDELDLRALGDCQVQRASTVEFNADSQEWEVRLPGATRALFSHPSRSTCLTWETDHEATLLNLPLPHVPHHHHPH